VEAELREGRFPFAPDDEDIHMAVERRLTELAGPVGGRLHTARSRNDQVATDIALFTREAALAAVEAVTALMAALVDAAERHLDWPLPGYTHLQRAQPVYLSHHLLAYVWMLERDRARCDFARGSDRRAAARAGALAGVNFDTDRGPWRRARLRARRRRTRSTRSPTATSSWTTWAPPPRARRTCRAWAPSSCCGPRRSSASSSCPTRGRAARRSCPRRRTPTRPSSCGPRRRGSSAT
jgi:hypothetical protein